MIGSSPIKKTRVQFPDDSIIAIAIRHVPPNIAIITHVLLLDLIHADVAINTYHTHTYIYIIYIYIYIYVCVCVCVCVYIYTACKDIITCFIMYN